MKHRFKKAVLLMAGHLCLFMGFIGIFLPVLPTTPFLLLAAFCYSKSSKKLHAWIINHNLIGPPLNDWEKNGVIRLKAKIIATLMLGLVMLFRLPYLKIDIIFRITICLILMIVLIFIWSRPSSRK